jgi:hypothetical protein
MKNGSHHSKAALARTRKGCKRREKHCSPEARAAQLAALTACREKRWGDDDPVVVQQNKDQLSEKLKLSWRKLSPTERAKRLARQKRALRKPKTRKKIAAARKAYMAQHPEVYENMIASQGPDANKRKSEKMKAHWRVKVKRDAHSAAIRKGANKPRAKKRHSAACKRAMANNPALANRLGEQVKQVWADHRTAKQPKRGRGRSKDAKENRSYFTIGARVEKEIPPDRKQDRHSIVTARRLVTERTRLEYDVVAKYHQQYRRAT